MSTKKDSPVTKCHNCDNIALASEAICAAMRRKGLGLGDMYIAINRMIDGAVKDTIMNLRAEGLSIRKIARTVHMDDGRVSQIIKSENAKKCCDKTCKVTYKCKPGIQCNPPKPCKR